jgi:HEAT repeat protein
MGDVTMSDDLQLITSALESNIEEIRYRAAQRLFEMRPPWPIGPLKLVMADSSWRIRQLAVENLVDAGAPSGKECLEFLAQALDEQENAGLRNAATETLARLGPLSLPVLYPLVDSPSHDVRKLVADIMGEARVKESGSHLLRLLEDAQENVRAAAAEALGRIGLTEAVPRLRARLEGDTLLVKMSTLDALERLGQRVSLQVLQPLLSVGALRPVIYRLLARLPGEETQALLFEGVRSSRKSERLAAVRAVVEQALLSDRQQRVSTQVAVAQLGPEAIERVRQLLSGASEQDLEAVVIFLGWSGRAEVVDDLIRLASSAPLRGAVKEAIINIGRKAVPRLEKRLEQEGDEERILVLELLGYFGLPCSIPVVMEQALEASPAVSQAAIEQLARLAPPELIATLVGHLKRNLGGEADAPVRALVSMGGRYYRQVLEEVLPLLEEQGSGLRRAAAEIISRLARREELGLLMKMASDQEAGVRELAVSALGRLGDEQVLERLRVALADEAAEVRLAAVRALAQRAEKDGLNWLMVALRDEDPLVVREAIVALGRLGGPEQVPNLLPFVSSPVGLLAAAAVAALASLGEPRIEWLEQAARHADPEVRREAVLACEKLPVQVSGPLLERAAADERWEVRLQAVKSLVRLDRVLALKVLGERLEAEPDEWVKENLKKLLVSSSD